MNPYLVVVVAVGGAFLLGTLFGARTLGALYGRRVAQAAARLAALAVRAEMGGARLSKWRATDLAFAAYLRALRMNPFAIRPRLPARMQPARRAPAGQPPPAVRGGRRARR
jgi:hypothetical protein